jgi:hypothetical protein
MVTTVMGSEKSSHARSAVVGGTKNISDVQSRIRLVFNVLSYVVDISQLRDDKSTAGQ